MAEMTSLHMYLFTNECLQFFGKRKKKTHETFPMFGTFSLKMNAH